MATDRDLLAEAQEQFDECEQAEAENRRDALDDLRFARLAEQWPTRSGATAIPRAGRA